MKYITMITLAGALLATAVSAQTTAYSKPSGFVTHTLKAGQFNLIGLTLHEPVTVSGIFETVSGTSLTDDDVDFDSTLTAGKTYILEITENTADPTMVGVIQEVTSWSGNTLTTPADLDTDGLATGAKYQLRAAKTIADVFGANNEVGLLATSQFNPLEADIIFIPNGSGFDRYFYSDDSEFPGWFRTDFTPSDNTPLLYMDSILIDRKGATDLDLVITGAVKTAATCLAIRGGENFDFVSSVYPVGSTLGNSGLKDYVTATSQFNATEADLVYMQDDSGGYDRYFYSDDSEFPGWFKTDFTSADDVNLNSGIIILRRGAATNVKLSPPSNYTGL